MSEAVSVRPRVRRDERRVQPWLVSSLAVAFASAGSGVLPFLGIAGPNKFAVIDMVTLGTIILSLIWLIVFVSAFFMIGRRALWLLAGLPFAAIWLVIMVVYSIGMWAGMNDCAAHHYGNGIACAP